MRKIGLFGGSFDPIHSGHIELATQCINEGHVSEVWFILAYDQPLKDKHYESFENRGLLIEEAIKCDERLKLLTLEKDLPKPSYSYNTVKALKEENVDCQFVWIIGSDNLERLDEWYRIDDLKSMINFLWVRRNQEVVEAYDSVEFDHPASSTLVREGNFKYLSESIRHLIFKHQMYEDAILFNNLSDKRASHVKRCVDVAVEISEYYDVESEKVYTAMLLHDITKELDKDLELKIMKEHFSEYLEMHPKVYHQYTGSYIANVQYKISDEDILKAIKYHTTGEDDSLLGKIIYVSDKVERGRPYDTENYISLAKTDIDAAFIKVKHDGEEARKRKEAKQ